MLYWYVASISLLIYLVLAHRLYEEASISRSSKLNERQHPMATKIFVGKLSFDTVDKSLNELFSQFGEVKSADIIIDRATNRSKGFGFVEMTDDNAAKKAIESLNNKEFEGQTLIVNIARPREDSPRRDAGFRRSW